MYYINRIMFLVILSKLILLSFIFSLCGTEEGKNKSLEEYKLFHVLLPLNYAKTSVIQCPFPGLQVIQIPKESKSTFFFVQITQLPFLYMSWFQLG